MAENWNKAAETQELNEIQRLVRQEIMMKQNVFQSRYKAFIEIPGNLL